MQAESSATFDLHSTRPMATAPASTLVYQCAAAAISRCRSLPRYPPLAARVLVLGHGHAAMERLANAVSWDHAIFNHWLT